MNTKPLEIMLISPLPPPKGGISHWTDLITRYSLKDKEVTIVNFDTAVRARSSTDFSLLKRIYLGGSGAAYLTLQLFIKLFRNKPDLAHINSSGSLGFLRDFLFVITLKLFKVPVAYHIRFGRIPDIKAKSSMEWHLFKFIANLASTIIVIDKGSYKVLENSLKTNVKYIPNCFDPNSLPKASFRPSVSKVKKVVYLGWVIPTKGIIELLKAWRELDLIDVNLHLVGPVEPVFLDQLKEQFELNNVIITGALEHTEAMDVLSSADVFVFPSHTEGFPNAVLEAMALGIPIVASDVGAIPDMLSGGCGLVVPAYDINALKSCLNQVINSEEKRNLLSAKCKDKADKIYSIKSVYQSYKYIWFKLGRGE